MAFTYISKRGGIRAGLALVPVFFVLWYYPYIDFRLRLAATVVLFLLLAGLLALVWRFKSIRLTLIGFCAVVALFLIFPARLPENREPLREAYGKTLQSYTGCRYFWGGEGYFGIDCSGLIRKGMEDALVEKGLTTLNPALIRSAIDLYWHDTSAKVIGQGYNGRTWLVTTCPSLNSLDPAVLLPGDMAVTDSGIHIMAYLGHKTWIAADPGEGRVTVFKLPVENSGWFVTPMKIVRWNLLSAAP